MVDAALKPKRGRQTNRCLGPEVWGKTEIRPKNAGRVTVVILFGKLGHSKAVTSKEDCRKPHAYPGKMHAHKSPEKTVSLHLRLILSLRASLANE